MSFFIDWLTVYQNHPEGGLPEVTKSINIITDPDSGEMIKRYTNYKQVEGSFSSSISVRCDGYKVYISGNPSKWNRPDNLFGFSTFDECIRVFNLILAGEGLPPLTKNTGLNTYQKRDGSDIDYVPNGAVITRVDLTENLSVGQGNEEVFIRSLSTQSVGRYKPYLYTNNKTVEWGRKSTLILLKIYNKAYEIRLHAIPRFKRLYGRDSKAVKYLEKLAGYCELNGVVRNEKEFKNDFLKRNNLNLYGKITEKNFIPYLQDIEKILGNLDMNNSNYINISEQLLNKKIVSTVRAANTTQMVAMQWLHGSSFQGGKSQYHVHKARLKSIGIDISIPFDATKIIPQIKNERTVKVSSFEPPSWYQMPKVAMLRAV